MELRKSPVSSLNFLPQTNTIMRKRLIPPGKYGATMDNKNYAVAAMALLATGTHKSVSTLWAEVTQGDGTEHQSQMDIVMALWKNGLVVVPKHVAPKTVATKAAEPEDA